jgi:hypothetical protein
MNSASFHARVVVASCGMSVVVELGSALSSMLARSGLMRLFMFIWPLIWVGIHASQGLGGAGADGIPPCPAWENRPMMVVTVQGAPKFGCDLAAPVLKPEGRN